MSLDLSTTTNWTKVLSQNYLVQYISGNPSKRNYKYIEIPSIYLSINSNVLLIGIQSNSAEKHWYLGARVSQYLYISPSTSANFIRGVEASDQKRIRLDNLTLVSFKDYGIYPYVLAIEIPYWLEDAYIEVWEYNQIVNDAQQAIDLQGIEQRLNRIERKIDNLLINPQQTNPSVNSFTNFDDPNSSTFLGII